MKEKMFQLIDQRLASVLSTGERSWTAPIQETSRHTPDWNILAIAATQQTPTLKNGKVLKWLGSVRYMNLVENHSKRQIEIADDNTNFLSDNDTEYNVTMKNYGKAIKKYNTISAYEGWKNHATQNPFKEDYELDGKC